MTNLQRIKQRYKMPFLKRGLKVVSQGQTGIIASFRGKKHKDIGIRFNYVEGIHYRQPNWQMKYYDASGNLLAEYKD